MGLGEFAKELKERMDAASQTLTSAGEKHPEFTAATLSVVQILRDDPILAEACLKWLQRKQSEMLMAKLRAIYTEEELQAMLAKAQGESS